MATSDGYAQAARALHWLLQNGHAGLGEHLDDVLVAVRARDQVVRNLHHAGLYLVGATHESVRFSPEDMLRHPVRGLTAALGKLPSTGLHGPAPSDVSLSPPTHPAARTWVQAAHATELAAFSVSRARPEHLRVQTETAILGNRATSSATTLAVEALRGNHIAWSLAADLAAVTAAVSLAEDGLAEETRAAARRFGSRSVARAADRLTTPTRDDVRALSTTVLRLAETGPLLPAYDLRPAAPRAVALQSVWQAAAGLDRAIDLLDGAPTLTGPQHRALAGSMAAVAHRLGQVLPADQAGPLERLASSEVLFAAHWTHTAIGTPGDGTWQAPTQLAQVGRVLGEAAEGWLQSPPDAALRAHLERTAQRLPSLVHLRTENLASGLAAGHFLMPSEQPGRPFEPVPPDVRWRTQVEAKAGALVDAAAEVRCTVGPRLPLQLAEAGTARTAHAVLSATVSVVARPSHPALQPADRGRSPGGRRR